MTAQHKKQLHAQQSVAELRSDPRCQARLGFTKEAVESYAAAYKDGATLPALEAFEVDGALLIVDGFHRLEAAKRAEVATLPVVVVGKGTMDDAIWEALGKNHNHGVRRSREDKRKAVQVALSNPAAAKMSNRKLAQYLDVSHTFVANERKMFDLCGNVARPEVEWARTLIAEFGIDRWRNRCEQDVADFEKNNPWTSSDPDNGVFSYAPHLQWMRMAFAFNRARFQIELAEGQPSFQFPLNVTLVACIIARACGFDPDERTWKQVGKGWSLDYDIPYDDASPRTVYRTQGGEPVVHNWGDDPKLDESRRLNQEIDLLEIRQGAPHRHIRLRSKCRDDGDWNYPDRNCKLDKAAS
jgi:hypothetical protein